MGAVMIFLLSVAIGAAICGIVWFVQIIREIIRSREKPTWQKIVIPIVGISTIASMIALSVVCFR